MKFSKTTKKKNNTRSIRFDIISAFPGAFSSYLDESIVKRARDKKIISIRTHDVRKFSRDRHSKIDAKPFGGGPGMVLQIKPVYRAVQFVKSKIKNSNSKKKTKTRTILFSTRGKKLDAKVAQRFSKYDCLVLICGRYEGVDERVATHIADEEISIGDYILSGGELPALVLIEAVSRFIPGFLGKGESLEEVKGSYPVYTRPASFVPRKGVRAWNVPKELISGNHHDIHDWRASHG
ncbi:MAG: tRNA (guanosine(37)-N1)-methyltransferase TrmD [Patescibacteria group bacterium]|nr:tRNA (guanosine(37)-N1)-methyltransferase TrmD [Patescibacteria group bacterium]